MVLRECFGNIVAYDLDLARNYAYDFERMYGHENSTRNAVIYFFVTDTLVDR